MKNKSIILSIALFGATLSGGCASTKTMIQHRNLAVETKMSDTIFLDPMSPSKKVILVQVKNTSDKVDFNPTQSIRESLVLAGYTLTDDPDKAHLMLQANILKVGAVDKNENALSAGYGGALEGGLAGVAVGAFSSGRNSMLAGGLVGAAVGTIADAVIKDVAFNVVTDLQISERISGVVVTETLNSNLKQGSSANKNVSSTQQSNWKRYQTRIVSTAGKVNLKFEEAKPALLVGISQSISGIFS